MNLAATYTFDAPVERDLGSAHGHRRDRRVPARLPRPPARGDDRYEVELGVAVAAIAGDFKGTVALQDRPAAGVHAGDRGTGRQGFIKGRARVTLEAEGERTLVKIAAQAESAARSPGSDSAWSKASRGRRWIVLRVPGEAGDRGALLTSER